MLMKHTQVTRKGEVHEPPLAQLTYGALLQGRTAMVADAGNVAKKALTIALRYAAVRRQFKTGENEVRFLAFLPFFLLSLLPSLPSLPIIPGHTSPYACIPSKLVRSLTSHFLHAHPLYSSRLNSSTTPSTNAVSSLSSPRPSPCRLPACV
jgi:hypothetical protein